MKNLEQQHEKEIERLSRLNLESSAAIEKLRGENAAQNALLKQRELDFQRIVDSIPIPVAVTTPTGGVEALNEATLDYFGLTLDQLKGWTSSNVVHPDDLDHTVAEQLAAHARGQSYNVESRHRRADGVYRWFNVLGLPVRDSEGQILRWLHLQIDIDDRKRAEAELKQAYNSFADAQRLSATGSFITDLVADQHSWSPEAYRIFEFAEGSDVSVARIRDMVHPDDMANFDAVIAGGASGQDVNFVFRVITASGALKHIRGLAHVIENVEGRPLFVGALQDVTESKLIEEALRTRERDAQALMDGIPVGAVTVTATGEIETVNKQILDYLGQPAEVLKGWMRTGAVVHPDDYERAAAEVRHGLATGEAHDVDVRLRRHDGVFRWFQVRAQPLRDNSGAVLRWYVVYIDIDDRKRAEEALREREREARSLIDGIPVGAAIERPDGVFEVANQTLLDYHGLSLEELQEWRTTGAIVHPDDQERAVAEARARLAASDPKEVVVRLRRSDGVYRWFQVRAHPFLDSAGGVLRWYVVYIDIDDRKRAEDAVAANEQNLQMIIDTIPTLAWSAKPDGEADFLNQHYVDFVGLPAAQLSGWGWASAVHADDVASLQKTWGAILQSGQAGEAEARLRRFDGDYRTLLFRVNPLRNAAGEIVKWYGANIDIEDRKRAEESVRSNEQKLNLILNTIPISIHLLGTDGAVLYVNQTVLDYTGVAPEDVSKPGYREHIFHPDDLKRVEAKRLAALQRPVPFTLEMRTRKADGAYRWFLNRYAPLLDEDGQLEHWYAASTDIDDLKRTEAELKETNDFFQEAQRLGRTGSFITDMDGDEHIWSDEARRIWGFERGDKLCVADIRARIHPDDLEGFDASAAESILQRRSVTHDFRVIVDGATRHLRLAAHAQKRNGHRCFAGALQDVTDQKLADAALDHARSELTHAARALSLGVLTASIAHEVNQPLSGILTNANTCLRMLAAEPPNVDGARETARRTIRDGRRASDVISRLRTLFSRKEAVTENVDLNDAVREVLALSAHEFQRHDISVITQFDPSLGAIKGDRVQIQQVIINLLLNACDAIAQIDQRKRRIVVTTRRGEEGAVELSVRDTGVGLPEGVETRLFDAFYTTKADGMGIGLSVSRSIIERHGGRLWAKRNDGVGATFIFSVPSTVSSAPAPIQPAEETSPQ